ncbi:hypothetical protein BJ166DRAFT_53334 [Pestalotiopsis sp. NC0098]|nr:hypothetical protein BJ166DRAFT_53334 [Pestalotiopsis sp. NC0098]
MQLFNLISLLALAACTSALALPPVGDLTSRFLTIQSTYIQPREAPWCFGGEGGTFTGLNEGITTLRARAAEADGFVLGTNAQMGGQCLRLTCSYSAAIWACNDADVSALVAFENVARYAENIRDACGPASNMVWAHGQQFASEATGLKWNIIVGRDASC